MNDILYFQHGTRLSWNRDFLSLDDQTGNISSIRLNFLQRILRIMLGSLASLIGINAFYASTILSQKRITSFDQTKNPFIADQINTLVHVLNALGTHLFFKVHLIDIANKVSVNNDIDQNQIGVPLAPFFQTPIPAEVADHILDYLDVKHVTRMREVNRQWKQCVQNSSLFKRRIISSCLSEAKKALSLCIRHATYGIPVQDRILFEIFKVELKIDIDAAFETAQMYSKMHIIMLKWIMKILSQRDIETAKIKALTLKDKYDFSIALSEIVKVEAKHDFAAAKKTSLMIPDDEVRKTTIFHLDLHFAKDFSAAKAFALLQLEPFQSILLCKIVKIEAKSNIASAKENAFSIEHIMYRDRAFSEIIKLEAQTNLSAAKATVLNIQNEMNRAEALHDIIKLEVLQDISAAKETALNIQDEESRAKALRDVINYEARQDISAAKKTALTIQDENSRLRTLCEIIKLEALRDISAAKESALNIQIIHFRELALLEIIKVEVLTDISAAKKTSSMIHEEEVLCHAQIVIAKADPQHNFSFAKATALRSKYSNLHLESVVVAQIPYDFFEAKQTALTIHKNHMHKTFIKILKAEVQRNFSSAKLTTLLFHSDIRIILSMQILKEIAKRDVFAAKPLVNSIQDPTRRAQTLVSFAKKVLGK